MLTIATLAFVGPGLGAADAAPLSAAELKKVKTCVDARLNESNAMCKLTDAQLSTLIGIVNTEMNKIESNPSASEQAAIVNSVGAQAKMKMPDVSKDVIDKVLVDLKKSVQVCRRWIQGIALCRWQFGLARRAARTV
ncbi:hypothetical protein ACQPW1_05195 [Nocardia sp. CA-128927]|uniref:hypothetical protein n=1 Tax=Nocardia sp. CA-128927 TaxID=3239975 RepID=UPI003D953839